MRCPGHYVEYTWEAQISGLSIAAHLLH